MGRRRNVEMGMTGMKGMKSGKGLNMAGAGKASHSAPPGPMMLKGSPSRPTSPGSPPVGKGGDRASAGANAPPKTVTRSDGRLGGRGKPTPFKPQSIVPPSMAVHGKT